VRNWESLVRIAESEGAVLLGAGKVGDILKKAELLSTNATKDLEYAISIGTILSNRIIEEIEDHPTKLYFYHYRRLNIALDQAAIKITSFIQKEGFEALPIPASQTIDWENQRGHLSHKIAAVRAGLGWIGRNNLIINEDYGARVRYVTVLTDIPLPLPNAIQRDCGACRSCISVCPAGAIGSSWEEFDRQKCTEQLKYFSKKYQIGHYICGICVKACPGDRFKKISGIY
jgi:epoxyqueuosine reductase QueG